MRFRLFGTEIYVSFLFFAVITFMLAVDRTGYCLPTLCAAAFHETGHLFAMWISDCRPKAIRLVPASVSIVSEFPRKRYGEMLIAVSGPLFNIVLFCSLMINYKLTAGDISLTYALINLVIGCFNLLPVKGLDGGTVLEILLSGTLGGRDAAERVVKIISVIIGLVFLFTATFLILGGRLNLSLVIVGIYVLICAFLR